MRQITDTELWHIREALATASDEIEAAEDDGWVCTTDVHELILSSMRTIGAILKGPKVEIE